MTTYMAVELKLFYLQHRKNVTISSLFMNRLKTTQNSDSPFVITNNKKCEPLS